MAEQKKTRGLGRGLSALMADVTTDQTIQSKETVRPDQSVPVEKVFPNPDQPRRHFTPDDLAELAESIRAKGIIQPLIVRPKADGMPGDYEIVAGERRWRAAQMAQLHEVPILIRQFSDSEVLEVAIIENIQRADLNAVEEAAGYRQLQDKFGHTQEKLAEALGKSRSHIANLMRLLTLPSDVQDMIVNGDLSAGHARALITANDPSSLARQVVGKGLSVRATEALAKEKQDTNSVKKSKTRTAQTAVKDADTQALEADLSAATGLKVTISHTAGQETGEVRIKYSSLDELDDVCRILSLN